MTRCRWLKGASRAVWFVVLTGWLSPVEGISQVREEVRSLVSPRFSGLRLSEKGLPHLEWAGADGGLYTVEFTQDWLRWEPLLTASCNGGVASADDLEPVRMGSRRFYRLRQVPPTLRLSWDQRSPGQSLRIEGAFDPSAPTWVGFRDANGQESLVRTFRVSSNAVWIGVPPLVGAVQPAPFEGSAAVTVRQQAAEGLPSRVEAATALLQVKALTPTGLPAGTLTSAWLERLSALLDKTAAEWETLGKASGGAVDASALIVGLQTLRTNIDAGRLRIQSLRQGQTPRLVLGDFGGRKVELDTAALEVLDALLAGFLSGSQSEGAWTVATPVKSLAADPLADLDRFFDEASGPDSQRLLNRFDQVNTMAAAGVGILATTAVVLGVASAPAAAALAGTAGAVLFFTAYVAPAVMAVSSQALAAPFIEVQAGKPVPALEDYRPALKHLQKGSFAYLTDEVVGRLVRGVFVSQHASEDVASFFELYVNTSRSILNLQDLERPDSVGSQAYAQAPALFAALAPSDLGTDGTFVGVVSGSATETYPDAGWRHDVSGTLTLVVRGKGTVAEPYHGSLTFLGQNRISLVFCHSSVGCDPGGTLTLRVDDGDLYGAHGTLEGEGLGAVDGTGSFSLEWTGGRFQSSVWKGTVVFDLGVDQLITVPATLSRVP